MYHPKIQLLRMLKESKKKSVGRNQTHTFLSVSPPIYETQDKIMAKILLGLTHVTASRHGNKSCEKVAVRHHRPQVPVWSVSSHACYHILWPVQPLENYSSIRSSIIQPGKTKTAFHSSFAVYLLSLLHDTEQLVLLPVRKYWYLLCFVHIRDEISLA